MIKLIPASRRGAYFYDFVKDWQELFKTDLTKNEKEMIQNHERTGRPIGDNRFLCRPEKKTNRILIKQKPGPKKNN